MTPEQLNDPEYEEKITKNYNAYNKGFEAGKTHSQPSLITLQFMENITNQITELKQDLKETLKDIPRMADMELFVTKAVNDAIDNTVTACDKRYAPRYIATAIIWLFGVIGVATIGAIIKMIFDNITFK